MLQGFEVAFKTGTARHQEPLQDGQDGKAKNDVSAQTAVQKPEVRIKFTQFEMSRCLGISGNVASQHVQHHAVVSYPSVDVPLILAIIIASQCMHGTLDMITCNYFGNSMYR